MFHVKHARSWSFWSGGTAWLLHDQSLPGERSDVAGGEVYPRGGKPKPSGWPDTIVMPEEVRYRHIEEHHHHYAPPEHTHHGQPAAQNVTLGGVLLKLFGGR